VSSFDLNLTGFWGFYFFIIEEMLCIPAIIQKPAAISWKSFEFPEGEVSFAF